MDIISISRNSSTDNIYNNIENNIEDNIEDESSTFWIYSYSSNSSNYADSNS